MDLVSASKGLNRAASDLRFLLGRGYPREKCLTLVGNRSNLVAAQRELLRRAVMAPERAEERRAKLLALTDLPGRAVGLDGHNVLITLESALAGRELIVGDDGVIRDIARAGRGYRPTDLTDRAVALIMRTLVEAEVAEAKFYLDRPVSQSGRLAGLIRKRLAEKGLPGGAETSPYPERELIPFSGPVAGSDGELIEACSEPIDLAGLIIRDRLERIKVIGLQA